MVALVPNSTFFSVLECFQLHLRLLMDFFLASYMSTDSSHLLHLGRGLEKQFFRHVTNAVEHVVG